LAHFSGATDRVWEVHALLCHCNNQLNRDEEATFHGRRFNTVLEELRRNIPLEYRTLFDQNDHLQKMRALVGQIKAAPSTSSPSAAELQQLLQINKDLNQRLPLDQLLPRILECAIALTSAERCFALLKSKNRLQLVASRNVDGESVRRGMDKFSKSIARKAMTENRPVIAADAMEDSRFKDHLSIHGLRLRARALRFR